MGVCAGLGRHTGIDPVVFRVGFAVLLLGSGIGLFLYLAAFLLMKEPNGRPGIIEQWTRRDFDAEAVMALLTAVLGFGLAINLATVWLDGGTLVAAVFLAVSLLAAHANGVDLRGLVRSMPERLSRRRDSWPPAAPYAARGATPYETREAAPQAPGAPAPPVAAPRPAPGPAPEQAPAQAPEQAPHPAPPTTAVPRPETPAPPTTAVPRPETPAAAPGQVATPVHEVSAPARPEEPAPPEAPAHQEAAAVEEAAPPRVAPAADPAGRDADAARERREADREMREAAFLAPPEHPDEERVSPEAVTAQHAVPPYEQPYEPPQAPQEPQRPAYRPGPSTAVDYSGYGEPFAPHGPYRPLDPSRRPGGPGGYSPYDPALYGRAVPQQRERKRRPKSFIGLITVLLALIIGGIVVAVQARSAAGVSPTIVGGAMLITIGAGLLVAAWWGRGAGLVAAGTAITLVVGMGLMLGGVPRNIGSAEWAPTSLAEASRLYDVGIGDGMLDLSELELPPGAKVTFNAAVSAGELVVIVPPTARIEVHATNKVGDIVLDQSLRGGVDMRVDKVLEPDVEPQGKVATIVLNLRGGVGDMEVRRAA